MKDEMLSDIIKILKSDGIKITVERRLLVNAFISNPDIHFDFDKLIYIVKKEKPHYGIATLYRNLKLLTKKGIVLENVIEEKKYYELMMFNKQQIHAHLICKYCGNIDEYSNPDLIKYIEKIDKTYDFDVYHGDLNFYGICSKCKKNN
ncbi:Fur family transcriptional regulator [Thermoanaerobacterium sp. RBIITD]|uniref:Fur family transcriptional regulator n=1 Tax=Thermoanaerobacterium sp. RBIITD TaxID=1550240 RepID=UPI000BB6CB80|nr:Fur family transcriptional regulator [Thermoanaerobacterium sp. RBIITD]SNX55218.1 Fur family transcriptional regulator, ferric uptake regulator [Thermoanaerobacterium sp. RBIITD]